jgi:hypothetical protein
MMVMMMMMIQHILLRIGSIINYLAIIQHWFYVLAYHPSPSVLHL